MHKKVIRREVLGLLAGFSAAAVASNKAYAQSGPGAGAAPEPIKFIYGTQVGSISTLPLQVAQKHGFLEQEKLSVEYIFAPSSNATSAALASGQIDLCTRVVTAVVDMRSKGIDARIICAVTPRQDYQILVKKDAPVPTVGKDGATWQDTIRALKGKVIVTNGPGAPIDLQMQAYFKAAGLSPKDMTGVATGEGAAQIAALTAGTVDAIVYTTLVARLLEEKGQGKVVLSFIDGGPELISNMASTAVTSTDRFLKKYPSFADRYRRAVQKALEYMNDKANLAEVTRIAIDNGQVINSPRVQDHVAEIIPKYGLYFTDHQIQNSIDFQQSVNPAQVITLKPLDFTSPEALKPA
jgi:ABC-type nitrate/sulfonate/bicarbonate transport system substrate-binding protein